MGVDLGTHKEGLEAVRRRGRVSGRLPAVSRAQKVKVGRMRDEEHRPLAEVARLSGVSVRTVRQA